MILADGSDAVLDVYTAVVVWHGVPFLLPVLESEGGQVQIQPLRLA